MNTFKQFLLEQQQDIIDNQNGLGQVPNNANVDYLGLRVKMKPSTFLHLAEKVNQQRKSAEDIANHLQQGGKIASPFLNIEIPEHWRDDNVQHDQDSETDRLIKKHVKVPKVVDHEGRHRMLAVQQVYGDIPIEVHLFFPGEIRNRHITDQWIASLRDRLQPQGGGTAVGPLFEVIQ